MKHSYWMITLVLLIMSVIVVDVVVSINSPKASAPSITKTTNITGPLTVYYIAIDDNGKSGNAVGCGDSAVAVKTADVTTDNVVKATFDNLLSNHSQYYVESGLYNVLYNSNLSFVSSSIDGDTVTVKLSGSLSLAGVCDNPRVQAELEMAAEKAANVAKADIFINDKILSEVLSLK
jgi:hypothetical protein